MARARSADGLRKVNDRFALGASRAAREPNAQLLSGRLRNAHQHADKALGHGLGCERFFDELADAVLNTQPRAQTRRPAWFRILEFGDRIERLLHRAVVPTRGGFLAQADERSA